MLVLSASTLLTMMVIVHGLPQYRVFVDPPIDSSVVPGVSGIQVTLCFRELDSANTSTDYCPLGMTTLPAPGPNDLLQFLSLQSGADTLSPLYPLETSTGGNIQGFGLLMSVTGVMNNMQISFGSVPLTRVHAAPGQTAVPTSFLDFGLAGQFRAFVGADCLPDFTGLQCNTSIPTTTEPPAETTTEIITTTPESTTMEQTTMVTTTTEEMTTESTTTEVTTERTTTEKVTTESTTTEEVTTESTTMEEPTSESTTREEPMTVTTESTTTGELPLSTSSSTPTASSLSALSFGIGYFTGFVTAVVIALLVSSIGCLVQRRRKQGAMDEIEMARNPVYGVQHNTMTSSEPDSAVYSEVRLQ